MAELNFPSNPADGDIFGAYTYSQAKDAWDITPGYNLVTHLDNLQDATITEPLIDGQLLTYSVANAQWENQNPPSGVPSGALMIWTTDTAPEGFLICAGQAVSRGTYASLFAAIGTSYGAGDGGTTFNVPNLKGKIPVGKDSTDPNFNPLNTPTSYIGSKTHSLSEAQMPRHTHIQNSHNHTQQSHGHSVYDPSHNHGTGTHAHLTWNDWRTAYGNNYNTGSAGDGRGNWTSGEYSYNNGAYTGIGIVANTALNNAETAVNQYTGGTALTQAQQLGDAHNIVQPYIVLNYIIKT